MLPEANATGTFFACIWDTGGVDQVVYNGTSSATIDLRAATWAMPRDRAGSSRLPDGIYGGLYHREWRGDRECDRRIGGDSIMGNAGGDRLNGRAGTIRLWEPPATMFCWAARASTLGRGPW